MRGFFIFLILLSPLFCAAQSCLPGVTILPTQLSIDTFSSTLGSCNTIEGDLIVDGNFISNLDGLNRIDSIYGDLIVRSCPSLEDLDGLEGIRYIRGQVRFTENNAIPSVSFAQLTNSGKFVFHDNHSLKSIYCPLLTSNNGVLIFDHRELTTISMPSLINANGEFDLLSLPELTELNIQNLQEVAESFELQYLGNLPTPDTLTSFKRIGGFLKFTACGKIRNVDFLHHVDEIGGFISISQLPLESLEGLHQIDTVKGDLYLTTGIIDTLSSDLSFTIVEGSLTIIGSSWLKSINGLSNIKSIGGSIQFNWTLLKDFSEFRALEHMNGQISIRFNAELESLEGLHRIPHTDIQDLVLENNNSLSFCDHQNICTYLATGNSYFIVNNAPGCNSVAEVVDACIDFYSFQYTIFYDEDLDGIRDAGEFPISSISLAINPLGVVYYTNPFYAGIQEVLFPSGEYAIYTVPNSDLPWDRTTLTDTFKIVLDTADLTDTLAFGYYPGEIVNDLTSHLESNRFRCDRETRLTGTVKNTGTTVADGICWIYHDERIENVAFVNPPDTTIGSNLFGFKFYSLYPGASAGFQMVPEIPDPSVVPLGDSLKFSTWAEFNTEFGNFQSDTFFVEREVRCSFDPNDKQVNPSRDGFYTFFDEVLYYTIRFQNTGNDTAYRVEIRDHIEDDLDISSFELLNCSHPEFLRVQITDGRDLVFIFENINLVDSFTNFSESQGFISFSLNHMPDLPVNTIVNNSAEIYFDQNPPIITNQTQNILVEQIPTSISETGSHEILKLYPNPTAGSLYISSGGDSESNFESVSVYDITGRCVLQLSMPPSNHFHISHLDEGMYIIYASNSNVNYIGRVLKIDN